MGRRQNSHYAGKKAEKVGSKEIIKLREED